MNTRPVRLPPCAAGAKPDDHYPRPRAHPNPGSGRPQYGWSAIRLALDDRDLFAPLAPAAGRLGTPTPRRRAGRPTPPPPAIATTCAGVSATAVARRGRITWPARARGHRRIEQLAGTRMGQLHTHHCACGQNRVAERARPLLDSAAIPHDQQQARPALPDSVRRADGRRGKRHLDRRVSLACAAAQRLCAGRVDRGDGGHPAVAGGHPDRRRRGGLPRPQAGLDDLRRAVGVVGGRRPGAGADVRGARHQRRRAGRPRRARRLLRPGRDDGPRDDAARGRHPRRLDAGPRQQRLRGDLQPGLHRRARHRRPADRDARRHQHHVGDRGGVRACRSSRSRVLRLEGAGKPDRDRPARRRVGGHRRGAAVRLEQQGAADAGDRRPGRDRSVHADGDRCSSRNTSPTATNRRNWAGC